MADPLPLRVLKKPVIAALELFPEGTLPGLVLMAAAAAALIVANSPLGPGTEAFFHTRLGPFDLHHWINDGLMALFFFQVGLEVKRELVEGDLSTPQARRLPVIAALAGMAVPALIYMLVIGFDPRLLHGWAVSSATDIAFALGVMMLLGPRVPASLRLFLATVAIADDIGAVAIIALAYTASLDGIALAAAGGVLALLLIANRAGVRSIPVYALLATLLGAAVLRSGIHATVAGVAAALCVPLGKGEARGPLEHLEHGLAPWIAYLVLPVFGFANAGVRFGGVPVTDPLPLAVLAGLFAGKQLGVFAAVRGAVAAGWAQRPDGTSWAQIYGMALLCGIGFTMSLFIGELAFDDPRLIAEVKIGVLAGSVLSAMAGFALLRRAGRHLA
jgi:NhaA family Na+:H+ antiporter